MAGTGFEAVEILRREPNFIFNIDGHEDARLERIRSYAPDQAV